MRYIDKINSPSDLKKLNSPQLNAYAAEMRDFLVRTVAATGGHLSSNLGVVDLAIALHFVLDSPTDKIIWDVGHQCYPHKIITGRRENFDTLRQFGGMSGFIKSSESPHDAFDAGHSSTSLSAAHGMAVSRDLLNQTHKIAAVIGDGALTSGLALEAMNNIGRSNSDLLVVLNDNQMSISENVGALARQLGEMRTKSAYINVKRDFKSLLKNIPIVGEQAEDFLDKAKTKLKYLLLPGVLFEELGFKYYGPVDGHNMRDLVQLLANLQHVNGPVFLHVLTQKGKGYAPAERESLKFHGVEPFDVATGTALSSEKPVTYTDVFGDAVLQAGRENPRVVAITAAMPTGTGLVKFRENFPHRFFDVGIAESHAVTFAAGLAKGGLHPVVAIYSTFLQRAYDQIIHDVCIQNLPVVFALDRSGIVAADGETHQGVFDISFLTQMPNMTVLAPRNAIELAQMLKFAIGLNAPVAIRYPKETVSALFEESRPAIELGKWEILFAGSKIALVSLGSMFEKCADLYKQLQEKGYEPSLINARFAKPICREMLASLKDFDYIFTFEENALIGGFGQFLASEMNVHGFAAPRIHNFGVLDEFLPQGTREEVLDSIGLGVDEIFRKILEVIKYA